jgi:autotransporter translocation and assembly factor TamB
MKRNKVVKIAARTLALLLFCLAAVLLLLYCPPAQQKAAHWAAGWLQNRLHNTTRLDSFRLDFPRRIALKGVFLTDQKGDTLLYAGSLEVETNLWRLFHDTLPIRRVVLSDTHIRLAPTDIGDLNFQFILDAFDDGKPPSGKPPGIFIAAQETPVLLENVRFEWDAPASQSYFSLKTDSLHSRLEQVRIDTFQLDFSQMADRSGRIVWRSGAPPPPTNGVFRYDNVDLQHHTLQIDRLSISTDSILATLADFQARDAGGLEVHHVSTEFSLINNQLDLDRLALHANNSRVDGRLTLDIGDTLRYRANGLKGQLQSTDLTYFADLDFFKKNPGETFELFVTANGSLDELELQHFDFQTKKGTTALSLRGRVNNLRDLNNLGGDVTAERLRTDVRTLKTLSPEIDLPKELAPGDVVELQGRARGTMRQMNLELRPRYQPARGRPLTADLDATVFNASQPRLISWKVRVNSLRVPGPLVEKTLPPGTLPKEFTLPAETRISGNVNGDMRRLNGGLNVSTGEPGSTAHLDFSLNNWQGKNPQYQLDVTEATLDSALLAPFLKDSLLNQYLHLPPTVQVKGKLDGTTGNLSGEVHLLLPDSAQLGVAYRDSLSHQIVEMRSERFAPMAFLRPEVLASWGFDTLQRLDLQAKIELDTQQTLTVQGQAKRLDWSGWQISDLVLSGRQLAETGTYEALHVDARFDQKKAVEAVPFLSSGCLHAHIERLVLPYFDTLDDARRLVALGALALDSLELSRDTVRVFPGDVASQINFTGLKNSFEINSDWLAGSLKGDFDDRKLPQLLASWLNDHLRAGPDSEALRPGKDSLEMSFALLKPELFTSGLIPDLTALDSLEIKGFYHPGLAGMQLKSRKMEWQGHSVQRLESIVSLDSKAATAVMRSPKLQLNFQTAPEAMDVGIRLEDGTAMSRLQTLDSLGEARLSVGAKLNKDSVLQLSFDTTQILQYMEWTASPDNRIMFPADGPLEIHDLELRQDSQLMRLEGDMKNRFRAEFHALDLSFVPRLLRMAPNALAGKLEGSVHIDSLQSDNPTIQTHLNFNNLKTYGEDVGDMKFTVRQEGRDKFGVNASVTGANEIDLHGNFSTKESMNLTAEIKRFRLELARPFVKEYLSECGGEISGQITIGGTLKKPDLNTSFQLKETAIRPLANNVRYRLNDQKVNISHNIVRFDSLQLNDERNRHAWLSGEVNLNRPGSIELDLRFLMQDFLLLQMKETDTISYFGTLMTDASGTVKGSIYQPTISVNVKPSGASQVYYKIVSEEQEMAESAGIVVFVNPNAPPQKIEEKVEEKATFPFRLDLNLELPDNLVKEDMMKVKVILNPLTRDILEAKGHGTLNLDVFPDGEIHLNGRLEVTTGTAEYSYNNFFKRKFILVPGSNLIWTKDPYNPLMNLSAHYVVKTSPLPLLAGQSGNTDTTGTSKQTFWLTGSLNGYMDNVELKFKLEYPTDSEDGVSYGNSGDPQIKQAVNQVNENPTSLSQQVFSLLVFNTFSGAGIDQARVIDWQAGLNNLIAQQLNAMTSGITWIDIDFDLDDDSASGEADMDIRLKKSFFNNRVLFKASGETNINYSNAKRNLSGQFDEVSVEYKINKSGTLKATVFSEQTYNDLFLRRVNETGAGLIFEKEFGRVSDIFKRPNNNTAPPPKPAQ